MTTASTPAVRLLAVAAEYDGQRIDNYLLRILKGVPKSRIYRILRTGEVRVNGGRIKPDHRLHTGDNVRIPPIRMSEETPSTVPPAVLARLEQAVLLETRELLILDKPAGLAVHAGSGLPFGVIEGWRVLRPQAAFLELAHRLDRDTSGCLILAKTADALRAVQAALQDDRADKRYLLLARGRWPPGLREVNAPLAKNVLRGGERMVTVATDGKPALTRFRVVQALREATLLEAELLTGRTHQIRVHAAHAGYPLAGDDKYGDPAFNRTMAENGLKRLFLHAHSLHLRLGGRDIAVQSPLADDLRAVLDQLTPERR